MTEEELRADAERGEWEATPVRSQWSAATIGTFAEPVRTVLTLHLYAGCTLQEIADLMNLSETTVAELYARAKDQLERRSGSADRD